MRIAIIGLPGSGKTTLCRVLSHVLRAPAVSAIVDTPALADRYDSLIFDGIPRSIAELRALEEITAPDLRPDHVVLLETSDEIRAERLARYRDGAPGVVLDEEGGGATTDLVTLVDHLRETRELITISAAGSPFKAMALIFEAIGVRI